MKYWKTDFHDGTYKIVYLPEDVGEHKITVKYDGQEVPNSPAVVQSVATGDGNKCKINGMNNIIFISKKIKSSCREWNEYQFANFFLARAKYR